LQYRTIPADQGLTGIFAAPANPVVAGVAGWREVFFTSVKDFSTSVFSFFSIFRKLIYFFES